VEIGKVGLIDPAAVVDGAVVRQHKAYPIYDDAYEGHVSTVRADVADNYPTLHLVGRNGMHKYNNQDHAMMTAMLTVENILAGSAKFDVWAVNEDAEYTESGYSGAEEALKSERMVPRKVKTAA
jgi:protoporphyrinogen oxidase